MRIELDEIDMDYQEFEQRVENWRNWARPRLTQRVTFSLEGRYKSPQCWEERTPSAVVDQNDALLIEKALVNPTFPKKFMRLIVYDKIYPFVNLGYFCRKEGLNQRNIKEDTAKAYRALYNRLLGY